MAVPHDTRAPAAAPTATDLEAAALLVEMGSVDRIGAFGARLMAAGIVRSRVPGKHHTEQCYTLIGGRLASRLRRLGLAHNTPRGLEPTGKAKPRARHAR